MEKLEKTIVQQRIKLLSSYAKNPDDSLAELPRSFRPFQDRKYIHPSPSFVLQTFTEYAARHGITDKTGIKVFVGEICGVSSRTIERWIKEVDSNGDAIKESLIDKAAWRLFLITAGLTPAI